MDEKECQGVEKMFCESLQVLALSSSEQVRVTVPGCVTCEIYEDFIGSYESFLECFEQILTTSQKQKIHTVLQTLERMPEECFDCNKETAIEHQHWIEVRKVAAFALNELCWEVKPPEEYREIELGVWKRTE